MNYFLFATKYKFCLMLTFLLRHFCHTLKLYSQSEISGEQTSENVLGSTRLWLRAVIRLATAQHYFH